MRPTETPTGAAGFMCALLAAVCAGSEITVYRKPGDEVVLKPGVALVPSSIQWKQGDHLVAVWDGEETELYRQFQGRGSLNTSNGEMTITGLTRNESGLYKSEISGLIGSTIHLIVIPPVPKPTVSQRCDSERTSCTLSCDGDAADAAPVNYTWTPGEAASKELRLTKEGSSGVREFRCELRNPVSREISDPKQNPFSTAPGGGGGGGGAGAGAGGGGAAGGGGPNFSTGAVVFGGLLVPVLLLLAAHRCLTGMWFFQKTSMPWEPNFWRKHERPHESASNGTAVQENGHSDEETPLS
ncbi:cd58 [Pungitius sinensis]